MFADIFSKLLEERNITAYKLAKDLAISNSRISEWKRQIVLPSADMLTKLSQYFDVSVDYLLGLDPIPNRRLAGSLSAPGEGAGVPDGR